MGSIPSIKRPEWKDILNGEKEFSSFAPRLMVDRIKKDVSTGEKTLEEGVEAVHAFFIRYKNAYKKDLENVFKEW